MMVVHHSYPFTDKNHQTSFQITNHHHHQHTHTHKHNNHKTTKLNNEIHKKSELLLIQYITSLHIFAYLVHKCVALYK